MSEQPRPWWASDPDGRDIADEGDDPVAAHRAARRGSAGDAPNDAVGEDDAHARGATPGQHRGDGAEGDGVAGGSGPDHDHRDGACEVCPLCALMRALDDSRPELVAHLSEAARHLIAAARAVMEAPAERRGPSTPPTDDDATSTRQDKQSTQGQQGPQRIDLDP
ncbi:MAG: hypothetical protein ACLFRD_08375 [Nitriliruptoraceae bacterium]